MTPALMAGIGLVLLTIAATYALVQLVAWIMKPASRFSDVDALAQRRRDFPATDDYTGAIEYDADHAA